MWQTVASFTGWRFAFVFLFLTRLMFLLRFHYLSYNADLQFLVFHLCYLSRGDISLSSLYLQCMKAGIYMPRQKEDSTKQQSFVIQMLFQFCKMNQLSALLCFSVIKIGDILSHCTLL